MATENLHFHEHRVPREEKEKRNQEEEDIRVENAEHVGNVGAGGVAESKEVGVLHIHLGDLSNWVKADIIIHWIQMSIKLLSPFQQWKVDVELGEDVNNAVVVLLLILERGGINLNEMQLMRHMDLMENVQ